MGAGASASAESGAGDIYSQLMTKWDELVREPQYSGVELQKPANYEALLQTQVPSEGTGSERDFFLAMRDHFHTLVGREKGCVIEIAVNEKANAGPKPSSLQDAFKNRPVTAKRRPNKKLAALKRKENRENDKIFSLS
eukprot:CAMPEP_0172597550 /NCGR_PEP_ID=MMETSP1068-20121228/17532_1 /TAXON_ID=35684 /ORGANISM="Pseudopedinella elastica, Strain CCMP716" /LENGTH=137 /DNA_ID=CAMNT_0013397095 /DNA_START=27 /DNA_END=440 /DNA_ORIENTATION=+